MTTFFIILGLFLALFIITKLLEMIGYNPSDNPNDPRGEDEKNNWGGM